jgi:DNA polymerase elongation subunit (family B)
MTYLYLDIETIPTGDAAARAYLSIKVEAPANYKDPDKIAAFKVEAALTAWEKSSFDGFFGRVACIGWAFGDAVTFTQSFGPHSDAYDAEADTIMNFIEMTTAQLDNGMTYAPPSIVGHNVAGFDIPFLTRRMVTLGIQIPRWWPRNPKPWDNAIIDTMQLPGGRDMLSLDYICHALGIPGKDGMTGVDVWPMWQAGRYDEIAEYCKDDVERTRAVHRKFLAAGW